MTNLVIQVLYVFSISLNGVYNEHKREQTINKLELAFQSTFHLVEELLHTWRASESVGSESVRGRSTSRLTSLEKMLLPKCREFSQLRWYGGLQVWRLPTFKVFSFMDEF